MMNGIPKSVQSADQNAGGTHPQVNNSPIFCGSIDLTLPNPPSPP